MPASTQPALQNWKLTLAYDGTDFRGWQVQPGEPTIQGELQAALGRVCGERPLPQGSGRTDAGVHALAQVASFALAAPIPADNLQRALNRTLPPSIRILEAKTARSAFHARHSAVGKTYEYRVFRDALCPPFLARYVLPCSWPMDFAALEEAARHFLGTHDFLSFAATDPTISAMTSERFQHCATHKDLGAPGPSHLGTWDRSNPGDTDAETALAPEGDTLPPVKSERPLPRPGFSIQPPVAPAIRTIFSSAWEQQKTTEGALLVYRVRGSGFLHHMVRNLVGTMLDVGRGRLRSDHIPAILAARTRSAAGPTAPAQGLFLHSVEYDDREFLLECEESG